jgi:hypothetical protein
MASKFDESEFIDTDYESSRESLGPRTPAHSQTMNPSFNPRQPDRPPSREEIEARVSDTHGKLAELKRAQEQLERERAALEEARRRRIEFQNGREEMLNHLTRGTELLRESEFNLRRDAEQMNKSLLELQEALAKVESLKEEEWTSDNWNVELTRALTTLENARMEWNSARLKWPALDGAMLPEGEKQSEKTGLSAFVEGKTAWEICRIGLILSWPVAAALLIGMLGIVIVFLAR